MFLGIEGLQTGHKRWNFSPSYTLVTIVGKAEAFTQLCPAGMGQSEGGCGGCEAVSAPKLVQINAGHTRGEGLACVHP